MASQATLAIKLLGTVALLLAISSSESSRRQKPPDNDGADGENYVEEYLEAWNEAREEEADNGGVIVPDSAARQKLQRLHEHLKETGMSDQQIAELDAMVADVDSSSEENAFKRQLYGGRSKRAITGSGWSRWPFGIVPFMYEDSTSAWSRNEIVRAHLAYERSTCLRFVPWVNSNGTTTNDEFNLGHPGYVRHMSGGGCWSVLGNVRSSGGQGISCCGGTTCVHELGHALGLHHEQNSPDPALNWLIRTNWENISPGGRSQYGQTDPRWTSALIGYDSSSVMHYGDWGFSQGGKTFTKLYPELRDSTGFYYLFMEVSLAHECASLNCSDSTLDCQNDGYLTLVDNKCACKCVPGLDPDKECRTTLSSQTKTQEFPGGSYALPETNSGCPLASMTSGSRTHYNDGGNSISGRFDLKGEISESKVEQRFCVTENSDSEDVWPAGVYCIYRKGGTCPENFYEGYVQYDDKSPNDNNTFTGSLPDGTFDNNTRFQYCCRDNGFFYDQIFLPNKKPFALFKNGKYCQLVRGMHVYDQHFEIANSDDDGNASHGGDDDPIAEVSGNKFRTNICYYKPAMLDCGGVIELTQDTPTATITSPDGLELPECTWYLKTEEDAQILLNFDSFDISCNERENLEIQYFRPGQPPYTFCGKSLDRTIRSVNKTIVIYMRSFTQSSNSFSATASLVLDKDLSYSTSDRGLSYAGNVNFTRFFEPCLPWAEAVKCRYNPFKVMTAKFQTTLLDGNYCRNPDYVTGIKPWCYTNVEICDRNYCDTALVGNRYDKHDDCAKLADAGICSTGAADRLCAKTCNIPLPSIESVSNIRCPSPPAVADGAALVDDDQNEYEVGSKVMYKCNDSPSQSERVCLSTGQWSELGYTCDLCPFGWILDWTVNRCLKFYGTPATLEDARQVCNEAGASIATPKNSAMNAAIKNIINTNIWVPLNDQDQEGQFIWEDGTIPNWSSWNSGEPNNWGWGEDCTIMRTDGLWNDIGCDNSMAFVCVSNLLSSNSCTDFWSQCPSLYQLNPAMCANDKEFAHRMCPYTCGTCEIQSTHQCTVDAPPTNGNVSTDDITISIGETVQYACNDGFVIGSGQALRGCSADKTLTGEPLVCVSECPKGWVYYEPNKQCYGYFDDPTSWDEASTRCKKMGGYLAMPKTYLLSKPMWESLNGSANVWIGLEDKLVEDVFRWPDGDFLTGWENWDWWQPDNWQNEDCAFNKENGYWGDLECGNNLGYVCQVDVNLVESTCQVPPVSNPNVISSSVDNIISRDDEIRYTCSDGYTKASGDTTRTCLINGQLSGEPLTCVKDCPEGWLFSGPSLNCYAFFDEGANYDTAISKCANLNGTLPTLKSQIENEKLRSIANGYTWIGLDDKIEEGTMVWIDGTPLAWTNFAYWEPNNWGGNEDCCHMKGDGRWNDLSCDATINYACQVPLSVINMQ